jgi:hypothetical protein
MTSGNGIAVAAAFIAGAYVMVHHNAEAGALVMVVAVLGWIFTNVYDKS